MRFAYIQAGGQSLVLPILQAVALSVNPCRFLLAAAPPLWEERSNEGERSAEDMAADTAVGSRVARGRDWQYGDQDGCPPGTGTVTAVFPTDEGAAAVVEVKWDGTGSTHNYRMGCSGLYELRLLPQLVSGNCTALRTATRKMLCWRTISKHDNHCKNLGNTLAACRLRRI